MVLVNPGPEGARHGGFHERRARSAAYVDAVVDPQVAAVGPAQLLQLLPERCNAGLRLRVIAGQVHEDADAPHALALLSARGARRRNCRAREPRDDLPPPHEHLPRERTLLSTALKHGRLRYAIGAHVSFRFLPLPTFLWRRFWAADPEVRSDAFT